ncbi:MAG TPA: hypothetical protein VEG60_27590 [Candidatus Binatia bacterium]|nr:hypothetical protein [Candidatus Binatia bacterium]
MTLFKLVTLLSVILGLSACAGLPVRGAVGGQTIETRVDSEAASYYLGNYLAGKHSNPALDERIDRVYQSADGILPNRDELKRLSDEFSVDFAALYFADRIHHDPVNRRFRRDFDQTRDYVREAFSEGYVKLPAAASGYEVLFVPTYLYKRLTFTGADMAVPREALQRVGFTCHFVETDDDGPVETNADLVVTALRARAQSGRRLIIVSASKSGPEVALALTKLGPAETRHVAAWINTVGALQGSPVADEKLGPEIELIVGKVNPAGRESITTARSRQRFDSFHIPEHVLVVNYFGIPVSGSISFLARRGFFPLRKYGPNDGLVLLADMIIPRGVTLAELGSDHFLINEHLDVKSVALAITVVRWLENPDQAISTIPGS